MPRTKQTRRGKSINSPDANDLLSRDFEKHLMLRIHNAEADMEMLLESLESDYTVALSRFPPTLGNMTMMELISIPKENIESEHCESNSYIDDDSESPVPKTVKSKRAMKRTTTASDDGYMTEAGNTVSQNTNTVTASVSKSRKIRTRSSSRNNRTNQTEASMSLTVKKSDSHTSTLSKNRFKTPAVSKNHPNEYALVTPKIKPNTPLSVMRRPRQGEMALSMQGSPLLVTSVVNENLANVNVPLENGKVLSLLPNDGLRLSYLPQFDAETRRQLVTLKQHLDKVIGST